MCLHAHIHMMCLCMGIHNSAGMEVRGHLWWGSCIWGFMMLIKLGEFLAVYLWMFFFLFPSVIPGVPQLGPVKLFHSSLVICSFLLCPFKEIMPPWVQVLMLCVLRALIMAVRDVTCFWVHVSPGLSIFSPWSKFFLGLEWSSLVQVWTRPQLKTAQTSSTAPELSPQCPFLVMKQSLLWGPLHFSDNLTPILPPFLNTTPRIPATVASPDPTRDTTVLLVDFLKTLTEQQRGVTFCLFSFDLLLLPFFFLFHYESYYFKPCVQ